jgi:glycosyltransferase involved in cell wall biosynthesis
MNIGIDGHTLNEKEKFGVSTYTYEIVERIVKHTDEFTIYSKEKLSSPVFNQENIENRLVNFKTGWTQWGLSTNFLFNRNNPDVMFFPAHSISRYCPMRKVVAIHDLAFLKFPQYFTKKDLFRLKSLTFDAAKRANKIITCSLSTKEDIAKFYGKEFAEKTEVILLGFDKKSYNKESANSRLLKQKYGIDKPYLFYAGSFQPRKDLPTLIKAFEQVSQQFTDLKLVLAGGGGWMKEVTLKSIENSPIKDKIMQFRTSGNY